MLVGLVICAGGCQPLPAGSLAEVRAVSDRPRIGNVYLIRGWRDAYSAGVDQLAAELRQAGVAAHVYRHAQWQALAGALEQAYATNADHEPLVLIGFSYGADDALRVCDAMFRRGLPVNLVITIDPVTPLAVPGNVVACYNYYQTNGVWDVFPWFRGVPLAAAGDGRLVNVDLRKSRPDLVEPSTAHSTIAASPGLHREIIARVLEICRARGTTVHHGGTEDTPEHRETGKEMKSKNANPNSSSVLSVSSVPPW